VVSRSTGSEANCRSWRQVAFLCLFLVAYGTENNQRIEVPKGQTVRVVSDTYETKVPRFFNQSWSLFTAPDSVLHLDCSDIRLYESPDCTDAAFIFEHDGRRKVICQVLYEYQEVSAGPTATITLRTGQWGTGFVTCDVTSKPRGFQAITTTTPKYIPYDPYEGPLKFHKMASEEVDSTEHGTVPGPKGTTCPCGWTNKESQRIANGVETKVHEYPFMAALAIKYGDGHRFVFCGSTIITPYHALTAAHCTVLSPGVGRFILVIGGHDMNRGDQMQEIDVKEVVNHNYENRTHDNDIAVIVLKEKIQFNQYVGPICLPTGPIDLEYNYIKIIGWGMTHHENPSPDMVLRKVNTRILPLESCKWSFPYQFKMNPPKKMCSYATKRSSCFGDSGGPLTWLDPETNRYTQIGVVSFGSKECANDRPRVGADVREYLDWIHKAIRDTAPVDGLQTCSKLS